MSDGGTMLSRSGISDKAGKQLARVDITMSEELHAGIVALAQLHTNGSKSEWAKRRLEKIILGEIAVVRRLMNPEADRPHPDGDEAAVDKGIAMLASIADVSVDEWIRQLCEKTVLGELHMLRRLVESNSVSPVDESPMNSR